MGRDLKSIGPVSLPGLSGEVEGCFLALENLEEDYKLSELMCWSGVGFRLYYHRGPHYSGIDGRWFPDVLDYHSWDPWKRLGDYTGYRVGPLGKMPLEAAWRRVTEALDDGRAPIARNISRVLQPCPVIGWDESEGTRVLHLRTGPEEVKEQEFVNLEKGPPFNNWIERILLIDKKQEGKKVAGDISSVLSLAVRLAREGECAGGKYSAGLNVYADWAESLRGDIRSIAGYDPSGLLRVEFMAAMLTDLESRRRMVAECLTSKSDTTSAIHAGGLYSEIVSVLADSRRWFPRPWRGRFQDARDALMDPVKRARLAAEIERAGELERRAVEKMEETVGS